MEGSRENKFVCKFCHQSYPCGKSLGGHIRIHKNGNSTRGVAVKEKERIANIVKLQVSRGRGGRRSKRESESEVADGNSGYGLRENPKMTKRFADSRFTSSANDRFCRECGKGCDSSEALLDHLACHYNNEMQKKKLEDHHFGITHQNLGLVDDRSDSGESLESGEIKQEAAMSLMMMSRDTRFSVFEGLSSVAESSDNKSSFRHRRGGVISASNSNGGLEMKGAIRRKVEVAECGTENSDYEDSIKEACKKAKLKVSVHGSSLDGECKKPEVRYGIRRGSSSSESLKNSMENKMSDQVHTPYKYELRRNRSNDDSYSPDLESHKGMTTNGCESTHHSGENSTNTALNSISMPDRELIESSRGKNKSNRDVSGNEEKKLGPKRKHKCPICSRVFKSGQALGGHKRSHMVGSSEDTSVVMKQEISGDTGLFDLNVPAPMEEEESGRWDSFH